MCSVLSKLMGSLHILGSLFYLFYIYSKIMEHILLIFLSTIYTIHYQREYRYYVQYAHIYKTITLF